jgi:hypothetical protein
VYISATAPTPNCSHRESWKNRVSSFSDGGYLVESALKPTSVCTHMYMVARLGELAPRSDVHPVTSGYICVHPSPKATTVPDLYYSHWESWKEWGSEVPAAHPIVSAGEHAESGSIDNGGNLQRRSSFQVLLQEVGYQTQQSAPDA